MNRTTKRTIVQCTSDQQKLRSVCASTPYIKQASWMARSPKKVHTVRSAKDLIRMRCYSHTVYTALDSPAIEGKYDQDKICISYKLSPLHEMSNPVFLVTKQIKIFFSFLSPAELAQIVVNRYPRAPSVVSLVEQYTLSAYLNIGFYPGRLCLECPQGHMTILWPNIILKIISHRC